jgi:hypothetical protein
MLHPDSRFEDLLRRIGKITLIRDLSNSSKATSINRASFLPPALGERTFADLLRRIKSLETADVV